ncbi:hypothetical protein [Nocardia terpenica]|uniref:Uncharacterized protein n=1 Tax=Nocardia terpenica TaxID=455432 RepID=A0A164JVH7_9NOCA|nr:hypothetical protein [Nocardia terpenica]KZM70761.1 hypothetical protein AWN90_40080 [Nocardia terpenica]NQE89974.1 hypothetical protein [Nocardia terpenica]
MTAAGPPPFASVADVQSTWRALTPEQAAYAGLLLQAAAVWIYGKLPGIDPVSPAARIVSVEVVRDALQRDVFEGAPSGKITRGSRSDEWTTARTATVEELAHTLVFSEYHLNLLGLFQPTGPRYAMGSRTRGPDPIRLFGIELGDC